jgi:hypothetical protein
MILRNLPSRKRISIILMHIKKMLNGTNENNYSITCSIIK